MNITEVRQYKNFIIILQELSEHYDLIIRESNKNKILIKYSYSSPEKPHHILNDAYSFVDDYYDKIKLNK